MLLAVVAVSFLVSEVVLHVSPLCDYHVECFAWSVYCICDTRLLDNADGFAYELSAISFVWIWKLKPIIKIQSFKNGEKKTFAIVYDLWHIQHSNGLSFEWMVRWAVSVHFKRKRRPQSLHTYSNSGKFNDASCLASSFASELDSVDSVFSSSCSIDLHFPCTCRICWFRFDELLKFFPHFEQQYGRSFVWIRLWTCERRLQWRKNWNFFMLLSQNKPSSCTKWWNFCHTYRIHGFDEICSHPVCPRLIHSRFFHRHWLALVVT